MSLRYRVLYRLRYTPWDQDHIPAELAGLVEGATALPPGRAIDIGCGTGTQAVYLAKHGWQVTGIDIVKKALDQARRRAENTGVEVRWVTGDIAELSSLDLGDGYGLIHDRGCYHDLPDQTRAAYATGVTSLAAPDAILLLMTFAPATRRIGVANGASEEEIQQRFGHAWEIVSVQSDSGPNPPGPMKHVPRIWYQLRRVPE